MPVYRPHTFICSNCLEQLPRLRQSRQFRHASSTANPPLPPKTAFAPLSSRRLISLHGPDAPKYLQGLIAANVPRPSHGSSSGFYSAFLNAPGRVLHDVFIYPTQHSQQWRNAVSEMEQEGGYLIEVDANEVDSLCRHLKRYKLRAKISIRVIDEGEWMPWSSWGEKQLEHEIMSKDDRVPGGAMGSRVILPAGARLEVDAEEVSNASYDLRRIMLGVPEGQTEILKESALPQESNIDYMGGIDFRKGCYVGQELTIRTHHTGVVRKRILPLRLYDAQKQQPDALTYDGSKNPSLPPHGANISRVDKRGRSAGKWLGGVGNVGLALCRLEVMTNTVLTGEGSQWSPGDEFKISWNKKGTLEPKEAKVKAFVPEWYKERADAQRVQRPSG